jgi:nucleoside-diphosphate-sugar epimerase
MTITIIGAAGAIGRSVAEACHAAGQSVRLVGRSAAPLEAIKKAGDVIVLADVATAEGCRAALEGASLAVYALGLPYSTRAFAGYPEMMRLLVAAARAAGTRRLLLVTNVYPYGRPVTATVAEDHPRNPCSVKGRYRKEQEDILLAATGGGLETLSLRLPDFYGPAVPGSQLAMVVDAVRKGGAAGNLLGPAGNPHEFVFTPDVGLVVKALLEHPGEVAGAYNFAGAGVISMKALAEMIYRAAGQTPRVREMAPWLQDVVGLFMPVLRELREMRYLLETPVLLDDRKLRQLLPDLRKTSYADGARLIAGAAAHTPTVAAS